jgi:hypothetical protein
VVRYVDLWVTEKGGNAGGGAAPAGKWAIKSTLKGIDDLMTPIPQNFKLLNQIRVNSII